MARLCLLPCVRKSAAVWIVAVTVSSAAPLPAQNSSAANDSLFKKLDKNSDGQISADELSEKQKPYFQRLIRIGDANKDGKLSRQEFNAALVGPRLRDATPVRPGGANNPVPFSRQAFNQLDRNGDGKLTLNEVPEQFRPRFKPVFDGAKKDALTYEEIVRVATALRKLRGANATRNIESFFSRLDANKDGKLNVAEIKDERYKRYVTYLLSRTDKGADGSFTKAEFVQAVQRQQTAVGQFVQSLLQRFDKNRDGVITKDEAQGRLKDAFDRVDRNKNGKLEPPELARLQFLQGAKKQPKKD